MPEVPVLSLVRNGEVQEPPRQAPDAERLVREQFEVVLRMVTTAGSEVDLSFMTFERRLRDELFALARSLVVLFLVLTEAQVTATIATQVKLGARTFRRAPAQSRNLNTLFGVVRYTRLYLREAGWRERKKLRGFHPLDAALGLTADRVSMNLVALAARLATKMSFAEARSTLALFVPTAPSTELIEQAVLGLGRHTQRWFAERPAPKDDGDVLVIQIDSKGAPTATAEELERRRGKRKPKPEGASPRHRGRSRRARHPKKPRPKKGDKSKNAKMATMVVMYTLRRVGDELHGPINRVVYASFAHKEHAFAVARREANKRGFASGCGKTIQVVTDGETCFSNYRKRWFPEALHTLDVMHIVEKLWDAGECVFREASSELKAWVDLQRERLYDGRPHLILDELRDRIRQLTRGGPGSLRKRSRLQKVLSHIGAATERIDYRALIAADLEIGTGMVEGAIKHVIGKRCDHGGMRWIKERAEAVLQLRCIEINGDWDGFISAVHDGNRRVAVDLGERRRLQTNTPQELPTLRGLAA